MREKKKRGGENQDPLFAIPAWGMERGKERGEREGRQIRSGEEAKAAEKRNGAPKCKGGKGSPLSILLKKTKGGVYVLYQKKGGGAITGKGKRVRRTAGLRRKKCQKQLIYPKEGRNTDKAPQPIEKEKGGFPRKEKNPLLKEKAPNF